MKKIPMTKEDHFEFVEDLKIISQLLSKWEDRFYKTFNVNSVHVRCLCSASRMLTSKLCCKMDDLWYKQITSEKSPYYNSGIIHRN